MRPSPLWLQTTQLRPPSYRSSSNHSDLYFFYFDLDRPTAKLYPPVTSRRYQQSHCLLPELLPYNPITEGSTPFKPYLSGIQMDKDQDYDRQCASGGLHEEEMSTAPILTNLTNPTWILTSYTLSMPCKNIWHTARPSWLMAESQAQILKQMMKFQKQTQALVDSTIHCPPTPLSIHGDNCVEDVLIHFEQHKIAYSISMTKWPAELRATIKDNTLAKFLAVAPAEINSYEKIKMAILTRVGISITSRVLKFWDPKPHSNESTAKVYG